MGHEEDPWQGTKVWYEDIRSMSHFVLLFSLNILFRLHGNVRPGVVGAYTHLKQCHEYWYEHIEFLLEVDPALTTTFDIFWLLQSIQDWTKALSFHSLHLTKGGILYTSGVGILRGSFQDGMLTSQFPSRQLQESWPKRCRSIRLFWEACRHVAST